VTDQPHRCLICGQPVPHERWWLRPCWGTCAIYEQCRNPNASGCSLRKGGSNYCSPACVFVALVKTMPHEERVWWLAKANETERAAWRRYRQEGEEKWKLLIASIKSDSAT
jgi:hypothetical protein